MTTLTLVAGGAVRLPVAPSQRARATTGRAPSLHLTRRGRLVVALLALVLLFGGTLAATRANAEGPTSAPEVERYVVAPGDTLWAVAAGLARPGEDLRDVVRDIEVLNGMSSATLIAGQQILLPAAG
ncbi:MAG TPA: LysM peptidoglycan-binding domain-containing protein [Cellulomonas sp.]